MESLFEYLERNCKNKKEVVKNFLDSSCGVLWERIYWFIGHKEKDYPKEAASLKHLVEISNKDYIAEDVAVKVIEELKSLGYKLKLTRNGAIECIICNKKENAYVLNILQNIIKIKPESFFQYVLKVNYDDREGILIPHNSWICKECFARPDYEKLAGRLGLHYINPKWIKIQKL